MDLIDELKKQAEKQRRDQHESEQSNSSIFELRSLKIVSSLQEINNYLHDLVGQLNYLQPVIKCSMKIGQFGEFLDLQQVDYRLSNESSVNKENICLSLGWKTDEIIELEPETASVTKEQIEDLQNKGLLINYISRKPDRINIQGYIPATIDFTSDFSDSSIRISINNFVRLGAEHYVLNTDTIDNDLLDALGKFIMRRDNKFMDVLVEDSRGISIVSRADKIDKSGVTLTEELDSSKLRSLFNREQRLYLTYHNVIKSVGSRTREFIIGRAKDCDMAVNSDLASRHHALLVFRKGKFVLLDQSTNGTFVKPQGGKETYVQSEELPLAGSGFISLGKSVTVDNEHLIYYSCQ
jgi:hypothetical protein